MRWKPRSRSTGIISSANYFNLAADGTGTTFMVARSVVADAGGRCYRDGDHEPRYVLST